MDRDRFRFLEKQRLLSRSRTPSQTPSHGDSDFEFSDLDESVLTRSRSPEPCNWSASRLRRRPSDASFSPFRAVRKLHLHSGLSTHRHRRTLHFMIRIIAWIPFTILVAITFTAFLFPSYTTPPLRYQELRKRVLTSNLTGSANVRNEKVFIVASLADKHGDLVSGHWGDSVRRLVEILGPENAFVSVYEDEVDAVGTEALHQFGLSLPCDSSLRIENLTLSSLPHLSLDDGTKQVKRIAFLAEARNRALRPLSDPTSSASRTRWDRLLYLNDVSFDPIDAANLLFNTHVDPLTSKPQYRAACAADFINPFKFYDTYATRDLEGFELGVPFFPWFSGAGYGQSRQDVLAQSDAVRVTSCWGGMTAFEGKWFQPHLYTLQDGDLVLPSTTTDLESSLSSDSSTAPPLRFRYEPEMYWDASECCLIHADLAHLPSNGSVPRHYTPNQPETSIFLNPYIRVAYSPSVRAWLGLTRRVERLYTPVHSMVNWIASMPHLNRRRLHRAGRTVTERVWDAEMEAYRDVERTATPGGFCGLPQLSYLLEHPPPGARRWTTIRAPPNSGK